MQESQYADIVIKMGQYNFSAHRVIVCSRSQFLEHQYKVAMEKREARRTKLELDVRKNSHALLYHSCLLSIDPDCGFPAREQSPDVKANTIL